MGLNILILGSEEHHTSLMEESGDWQRSEEEEEVEEEEEKSVNQEQETEEEEELVDYGSENEIGRDYDDRPTKRSKVVVDRISELPDSVITHILSMMPTRDAVKTSSLSKRWRHTWASTSTLIYICDRESPKRFSKFVDKTLILHKPSKIHKFILKSFYEKLSESSVSLWVQAAVIKQVEELSIKFFLVDFHSYQVLPQSLYSCDSLKKLSLTGCSIAPIYSPVCWRSLKHLTLTSIQLEDAVIQQFLTGSPLLESLKLNTCVWFNRINIYSGKLRRLVINDYGTHDAGDNSCLEIYAPNLEYLEISGSMDNMKCKLKDVPSLVHAILTFNMSCWEVCYEEYDDYRSELEDRRKIARDLMEKVRHVRNLTLGTWIVQVLSTSEVKQLPRCLTSILKCSVLEIGICRFDLPGIARLLRSSPILERLVIDLSHPHSHEQICMFEELDDFDGENYWASKDMALQWLRTVEIVGFSKFVIEFAEFLLRNAKALEKMIFTKGKGYDNRWQHYFGGGDFFETIQKLLSLPRSSPRAQILLV